MSEENKLKRTVDEIRKEYIDACAAAGDRQYRLAMLKLELQAINQKLSDLNKEAAEASKETVNVESQPA